MPDTMSVLRYDATTAFVCPHQSLPLDFCAVGTCFCDVVRPSCLTTSRSHPAFKAVSLDLTGVIGDKMTSSDDTGRSSRPFF